MCIYIYIITKIRGQSFITFPHFSKEEVSKDCGIGSNYRAAKNNILCCYRLEDVKHNGHRNTLWTSCLSSIQCPEEKDNIFYIFQCASPIRLLFCCATF